MDDKLREAERTADADPDDPTAAARLRVHRCRADRCCAHADEPFDARRPPNEALGVVVTIEDGTLVEEAPTEVIRARGVIVDVVQGENTAEGHVVLSITGPDARGILAAIQWFAGLFPPEMITVPGPGGAPMRIPATMDYSENPRPRPTLGDLVLGPRVKEVREVDATFEERAGSVADEVADAARELSRTTIFSFGESLRAIDVLANTGMSIEAATDHLRVAPALGLGAVQLAQTTADVLEASRGRDSTQPPQDD